MPLESSSCKRRRSRANARGERAPERMGSSTSWNAPHGSAAYINEMVEAATGINLWREWACIEIAGGDGSYRLPARREEYTGVILSLARQDEPDTSAYNDPEICLRIKRHHHAGFILRSTSAQRVEALLESCVPRFVKDFLAVEPQHDKPAAGDRDANFSLLRTHWSRSACNACPA